MAEDGRRMLCDRRQVRYRGALSRFQEAIVPSWEFEHTTAPDSMTLSCRNTKGKAAEDGVAVVAIG